MDCIVHGILQARILEWVAFPFSRGSSQPWDQTQVSCILGRFFTSSATREAVMDWSDLGAAAARRLPRWLRLKNLCATSTGDVSLIPGSERSPREGNGNTLQYSCREITWTEGPRGLQSTGPQRVEHRWEHVHAEHIEALCGMSAEVRGKYYLRYYLIIFYHFIIFFLTFLLACVFFHCLVFICISSVGQAKIKWRTTSCSSTWGFVFYVFSTP